MEEEPAQPLIGFLNRYRDVFAWKPSDLTGVNPKMAIHSLNTIPSAKLVKLKRSHFGPEKDRIIENDVENLLEARHIKRIQFPSWLSNWSRSQKTSGGCVSIFGILTKHVPRITIRSRASTNSSTLWRGVKCSV